MQPDDEMDAVINVIIRQCIKDLDAEVERIHASREAMPPPIGQATKRRAAKQTAKQWTS